MIETKYYLVEINNEFFRLIKYDDAHVPNRYIEIPKHLFLRINLRILTFKYNKFMSLHEYLSITVGGHQANLVLAETDVYDYAY